METILIKIFGENDYSLIWPAFCVFVVLLILLWLKSVISQYLAYLRIKQSDKIGVNTKIQYGMSSETITGKIYKIGFRQIECSSDNSKIFIPTKTFFDNVFKIIE